MFLIYSIAACIGMHYTTSVDKQKESISVRWQAAPQWVRGGS